MHPTCMHRLIEVHEPAVIQESEIIDGRLRPMFFRANLKYYHRIVGEIVDVIYLYIINGEVYFVLNSLKAFPIIELTI